MIYYGLGEGTLTERNNNRMAYVRDLSNNEIILEKYIDETFELIKNKNTKNIIEQLHFLFYEEIPSQCVHNIVKNYTKLNSKQIEKLKVSIINNYKSRPERGFIWNMYHQFKKC